MGESVLVKAFGQKKQWVLEKIVKYLGPLSYLVKLEDGSMWKRHIDHLRKFINNKESEREKSPDIQIADQEMGSESANPQENPPPADVHSDSNITSNTTGPAVEVEEGVNTPDIPISEKPDDHRYPRRDRKKPDKYM